MHMRGMVLPLAAAASMGFPGLSSAAFLHSVAPGESLWSVAAADGLTVEQLATANGLSPTTELTAGSQLVIPPRSGGLVTMPGSAASAQEDSIGEGEAQAGQAEAGAAEAGGGDRDRDADDGEPSGEPAAGASTSEQRYVVQPGDTLTAIAERAGTTTEALAAANGLNPNEPLLSGTKLTLGGAARANASSAVASSSAAISQPVGAVAEGSPGSPPYPTQQTVSPAQVEAIASADGVPPSLANAIADMESGFNNEFISSANARGVMQITPGTWEWIGKELTGSTPLSPESALDNVRAGVLLLHSLLESTGGNQALAAAGYYQGLPSVLENGMYPSTRQYVSDVEALQQQFGGG